MSRRRRRVGTWANAGLFASALAVVIASPVLLTQVNAVEASEARANDLAQELSRLSSSSPDSALQGELRTDATRASRLLDTGWDESLVELERCTVGGMAITRISVRSDAKEVGAEVVTDNFEQIDHLVDCLNDGASAPSWKLAEVRMPQASTNIDGSQALTGRVSRLARVTASSDRH